MKLDKSRWLLFEGELASDAMYDLDNVCRAQHLKTLEWMARHFHREVGTRGWTLDAPVLDALLAQARKDVEE